MSAIIRIVGLLLIAAFLYGNANAAGEPCPLKDVVVERDIIDTAVNVGLITFEESIQLREDIVNGKKGIIDVNADEGIIAFGTITFDEEEMEEMGEADPEEGEYIDGEWYDAYH